MKKNVISVLVLIFFIFNSCSMKNTYFTASCNTPSNYFVVESLPVELNMFLDFNILENFVVADSSLCKSAFAQLPNILKDIQNIYPDDKGIKHINQSNNIVQFYQYNETVKSQSTTSFLVANIFPQEHYNENMKKRIYKTIGGGCKYINVVFRFENKYLSVEKVSCNDNS